MILTHGANSLARFVEIGGRRYPVVKIGNQLWMAENLDWKKSGISIGGSTSTDYNPHAWYYNNDEATYGVNGSKYGLLYNGYAVAVINAALPEGWRVPTITDFSLLESAGLEALKSAESWQYPGNNESGFNAKSHGACIAGDSSPFQGLGEFGEYYSQTPDSDIRLKILGFYDDGQTMQEDFATMKNAIALRLVKDAT
jgi:uncharacterized protein (TIGR02145 family)